MTDILTKLKTLLDTDWNPANTDSRTPTVINIFDVKRVTLNNDFIFLKEVLRRPGDNCSGGASKRAETLVVLDFRTMRSREQLIFIQTELERILNSNHLNVFGDDTYDMSDIEDIQDFSDQAVKIWRKTMDLRLTQFNQAIA